MPKENQASPMDPRKRASTRAASSSKNNKQGEECQHKGPCSKFEQLPEALVIDILARLISIKTLLNCRCVCKHWLSIISNPEFTHLHKSRSPTGILMKTFPPVRKSRKLEFSHVRECTGSDHFRLEKTRFTPKNNLPIAIGAIPKFRLVNSCNGFLCLSGANRDYPLFVCNPILGEYISIPSPNESRSGCFFVGLGFSIGTNEYKVLQLTNKATEAEIYTVGTRVWRSIGNAPGKVDQLPINAFLHGALHWVSYGSTFPKFIHSFDFDREQFRPLPLPTFPENRLSNLLILEVVEGCLHICVFGADHSKFDLWIMKDYGIKESWTKILVYDNLYEPQDNLSRGLFEPIMFWSNGAAGASVVCYNQERKSFAKLKITRSRSSFEAIGYSPSFVSLYDVSKGEEVKRVNRGKKSSKMLAEGSSESAGSGMPPHKSTKLNSSDNGWPPSEVGLP